MLRKYVVEYNKSRRFNELFCLFEGKLPKPKKQEIGL